MPDKCRVRTCDNPIYILNSPWEFVVKEGKKEPKELIRFVFCVPHVHRLLGGEWPIPDDSGPTGS